MARIRRPNLVALVYGDDHPGHGDGRHWVWARHRVAHAAGASWARHGIMSPMATTPSPNGHRVTIIGGGFGGLYAARLLPEIAEPEPPT